MQGKHDPIGGPERHACTFDGPDERTGRDIVERKSMTGEGDTLALHCRPQHKVGRREAGASRHVQ